LSQEYEIRTEQGTKLATFSTDSYYGETPVLEGDSEEVIQEKIAEAKVLIEQMLPSSE